MRTTQRGQQRLIPSASVGLALTGLPHNAEGDRGNPTTKGELQMLHDITEYIGPHFLYTYFIVSHCR